MESSLEDSFSAPPSLLEPDSQTGQQEFYQCLVSFYQTVGFWLDEPRLHDPALYLPALPPQYQPDRLLHLFQYRTVRISHLEVVRSLYLVYFIIDTAKP